MIPLAIATSAGILFLLRVLIALWMETTRTHHSNVQIRSKVVDNVMPWPANRPSPTLDFSARLRDAAEAENEADEGTGFRYMTH